MNLVKNKPLPRDVRLKLIAWITGASSDDEHMALSGAWCDLDDIERMSIEVDAFKLLIAQLHRNSHTLQRRVGEITKVKNGPLVRAKDGMVAIGICIDKIPILRQQIEQMEEALASKRKLRSRNSLEVRSDYDSSHVA